MASPSSKPSAAELRQFKSEASELLRKGKLDKALALYRKLMAAEPAESAWPQRAADLSRRLGQTQAEFGFLLRAADLYTQQGFLLKAVAACKRILEIDPQHVETQARLVELYAKQEGEKSRSELFGRSFDAGTTQVPLEALSLRELVPGAVSARNANDETMQGLTVIPLAEDPAVSAADEPPGLRDEIRASSPAETAPDEIPLDEVYDLGALPDVQRKLQAKSPEQRDAAAAAADPAAAATARALLPKVPLFSSLDDEALAGLIRAVRLVELADGRTLFEQGDPGDALYVVVDGAVAAIADGHRFSVLEEGAFFGEIALVTEQPRNATIRALVDTKLLAIDRAVVHRLIEARPRVLQIVLRFLRERLIHRLLRTSPLFVGLDPIERAALADQFYLVEAEKNAVLVEQGRRSDAMYILLSGEASVIRVDGPRHTVLASLRPGDVFGEISLLTQGEARATVLTRSKAFVFALPAERFGRVLAENPEAKDYITELAEVRSSLNREKLADVSAHAGARIELV